MTVFLYAQEPESTRLETPSPSWNIDQGIELPIGKTQWEIDNEHLFPKYIPATDDPPPQPSVNPGEFERMSGVLIRYPLGLSYSIIAEMSEDITVVTIVSSETQAQTVNGYYINNGVNVDNCEWLIAPSNSIWTRDYGPWFIFTGEDVQGISNHTYNRPSRPYDNMIPLRFGEAYDIPVYDLPLTHTGGNYMSDGMGISMSTDLVYDENSGISQLQLEDYMNTWLGVEDYDVVDDILSGGIHHIDCWAKMLNPGTILAKRLNPPNATLEANVAYWESKISSYGRPYEVIRIDCASSTPYTNGIILNDKCLVPIFNNPLDQQALDTWAEAMPGYEILGYTGSWVSNDAIHCRAMGITDRYMLRIVHVPLLDIENNGEDYLVEADIHAYSNEALSAGMPEIQWSVNGGPYETSLMASIGDDIYQGYIPEQPDYSIVEYYLHAEDESGRNEDHPFIGIEDPHRFLVAPDTAAPQIAFQPLASSYDETGPYILYAEITDVNGISTASVYHSIDGSFYTPVVMTNTAGNIWQGEIPGQTAGSTVYYYIEATDNSAAMNTGQSAVYSFMIEEAFYIYDVESGPEDWTHNTPGGTWIDQWHISTESAQSGVQSWKCGSTTGGDYGSSLDANLESPVIELMPQTHLYFQHRIDAELSGSYPDSCYDGGIVELLIDGTANWIQISPSGGYNSYTRATSNGPFPGVPCYSGHLSWRQEVFDLSMFPSANVQIRFRFGSDGSVGDDGWFIDDVVFAGLEDTVTVPLEVVMTPENPPINLPAAGGTFDYDLQVTNNGPAAISFDAWISVALPAGGDYLILLRENLALPSGGSIIRGMSQTIPAGAPGGEYQYSLFTGEYPAVIYAMDGFPFTKAAPVDGISGDFSGWTVEGWGSQLAVESSLPSQYSLKQNYPNPFNPVTTIDFALPEAGKVTVAVFNVAGQEITRLVDGQLNAGWHSLGWNAANLPSGIYFYRLQSDGFNDVKKMMLLK